MTMTDAINKHNWGPDEWANAIRQVHGNSVDAIINEGQLWREAHRAYLTKPRRWGRRWDEWCKDEFRLSQPTVSQYEALAENLIGSANDIRQKLPASWFTLYHVAMLRRDRPKVFNKAIADGRITPETTREQIKEIIAETKRGQRKKREHDDAQAEEELRAEGPRWRVEQRNFRQWEIGEPVDLILTDPPYAIDHLDAYRDLPYWADRCLADEAWCAVMTGQRHLPQILGALAAGPLEYVWTLCFASSSGRANGIQFLKIQNSWKPVVLLRKGKQPLREWTSDLISYDWSRESRVVQLHKWQQEVSPLQKIIRAMTQPVALIADPFCGSGTTGIAAISTGRHFIGCDRDTESIKTATARLLNHVKAA
jgi:site-specific DNA-methyltransferase (adenine-specific)